MMHEKRHPFKVQIRPIDFNIRVQKDPTLATIQELPLAKFWYSIKKFPQLPKKAIKILLPVATSYIRVRPDCLHILQLKWHNAID